MGLEPQFLQVLGVELVVHCILCADNPALNGSLLSKVRYSAEERSS